MKNGSGKIKIFLVLQLMNILYSLNGVLIKFVSLNWENKGLLSFHTLACLFPAVAVLAIYAVLWQKILSQVELTVAYMCKGMIVFWGMLWSSIFFDENISGFNILGTILIFWGVYLVTLNE